MRIFVTGATGFIGSAVVQELIQAGHQVLGLTRSDAGASFLTAAGAQVHRGDLEDLEALRSGAAQSDGVIHTAFQHDFSQFAASCELDNNAIDALGAVLAGSGRPLIVSGGTGIMAPGRLVTEDMDPPPINPAFPRASEQKAMAYVAKGVRASVVRLPQVHDPVKQGLITYLIAVARQKGVSVYVGEGANRWPAVHRLDCARLYRLVLEKGTAGGRYHPIGEEGVPLREIAEAIGRGLKIPVVSKTPEEALEHFGWLGHFAAADIPVSSAITQQQLGWTPTGPGLIADLNEMRYSEA